MTVCCRCMYVIVSRTRPECDCLLQVYVRYCEPYEARVLLSVAGVCTLLRAVRGLSVTVCCRCMYVIVSRTRPECDCLLQVYVRYCEPYEA